THCPPAPRLGRPACDCLHDYQPQIMLLPLLLQVLVPLLMLAGLDLTKPLHLLPTAVTLTLIRYDKHSSEDEG
ncbi:hypothetical protein RRG08_027560, partial [Elysia crispata]